MTVIRDMTARKIDRGAAAGERGELSRTGGEHHRRLLRDGQRPDHHALEQGVGVSDRSLDREGARRIDPLTEGVSRAFWGTGADDILARVIQSRGRRVFSRVLAWRREGGVEVRTYPTRRGLSVSFEDITTRTRGREQAQGLAAREEALLRRFTTG